MRSLTSQDLSFESVNTSEDLSCGSRNLFLYEPVQPLPGLIDVLDPEKVLHKFDCVALSNETRQRQRALTRSSVIELSSHPSERGN